MMLHFSGWVWYDSLWAAACFADIILKRGRRHEKDNRVASGAGTLPVRMQR